MKLRNIVLAVFTCAMAATALSPAAGASVPAADPAGAQPSIVGGQKTTVDEWPFIIAGVREGGPRPRGQSCSASVVAARTIVTTGHCFDEDLPGAKSYIYGLNNLKAGGGFVTKVVNVNRPPKYGSWSKGWDAAVVTVADDIPVKGGKFAKLATSSDTSLTQVGTRGTAVGYGRVRQGENEYADLKKATIPVVADNRCTGVGGISYDPKTMFCGGGDFQNNICQGDSGGPYVVNGVVVGLTSWGVSCNGVAGFAKLNGPLGDWVSQQIKRSAEIGQADLTIRG